MTQALTGQRLDRAFFARPVVIVARELLGKVLVYGDKCAAITETEAYLKADDLASHFVQGKKRALEAFAKGPGTVYMHPMRGWWGMDLVACGGSVLLRGVGLHNATGPARMVTKMGIPSDLHLCNVTNPRCPLMVLDAPLPDSVDVGPRIGISKATELPLRFLVRKASV